MLYILLIWIFVFITAFLLGSGFFCFIHGKNITSLPTSLHIENICMTGLIVSTVAAQIISIFYKVSLLADIILFVLSLLCIIPMIKTGMLKALSDQFRSKSKKAKVISVAVVVFVVLLFAYAGSRGYFHYDSDLYHGQSIKWIEEYGLVKGLGLLHLRLAYNSASFALSAIYSFAFVSGQSFHTVAAFIAMLCMLSALRVFHIIRDKIIFISDFVRIGSIYYIVNIFDEIVSPASDYFTMLFFIHSIISALDIYESRKKNNVKFFEDYIIPALTTVFIPTLKLSAAPVVILVFIPLIALIRDKKDVQIIKSIFTSLVITVPFFVRNFFLSGRLLYPSKALDIFNPAWKIPDIFREMDSNYIIAYGRGYSTMEAAEYPFTEWFSHWICSLGKTELIITALCFFSLLLFPVSIILRRGFKILHIIELSVIASFIFWLFTSPLIRYGMGYLLILPAVMFGDILIIVYEKIISARPNSKRILNICFMFILTIFLIYKGINIVNYIAGNYKMPYYLTQQDYGEYEVTENTIDGNIIYTPNGSDQTGYYFFPSTPQIIDGLTIVDGDIKNGFVLKK